MLPILYHAHHSLHNEDIPFWVELSRRYPSPLLELGCGTGRVLIPLAMEGKTVIGIDNDFEMLRVSSKNLSKFPRVQAYIIQADFTAFHLGGNFDIILLTCNTYSTLTTKQRQALLSCVSLHLTSGGIFVASMPNPLLLKRLPRRVKPEVEEIFSHPDDGEPVQVSSEWIKSQDRISVIWHYDHLFPNGTVDRVSAQVVHLLTPIEQHRQEFEAAGFRELTYLGGYNGEEYSTTATQLILIAKR